MVFYLILAIVLLSVENGVLGAITIWPALFIFISLLIGSATIYQSRDFKLTEYLVWAIVNLIYLIIGIIFFVVDNLDNFEKFTWDFESRPQQ